ncbi:hypothetical protein VCSRO206_3490 [Vibrio cholerae]|nr:hypothetical protein [Vibrio cholerae]EKF9850376.1 hypothetical protein [Vibrio cholerae]GHX30750.1 hypothetical protein VCSRO204_3387 [Vibrio cholerae]GHX60219.1 hypothetical protein VCSRO206_3490 [Vibrio cholerae]HAS3601981.1 hypothetical protein [Vibrio cholerae]
MIPALLVILSAALRGLIVNKKGTMYIAGDIGIGLPVDLTFAALSIILSASLLNETWVGKQPDLILIFFVTAVVQLGFLFTPCKGYRDSGKNGKAFGLWFVNILITFGVYIFLTLEVIK